MKMLKTSFVLLACSALMAGCANPGGPGAFGGYPATQVPQAGYADVRWATVTNVRYFTVQENDPNYTAIIAGGLVGGILGNQVGKGTGRNLATIAGVAGGAYAGNQIMGAAPRNVEMVELQVREDNGRVYTVTQKRDYNFMNGQRIRVQVNGNNARAMP